MNRFVQVVLRTTAVEEARAFCAAVLGERDLEVFPLHEQAIARGARPHWLGHLAVDDVDAMASAFCARGATPLGPKMQRRDGVEYAVLRDPGGAVLALAKASTMREQRPEIAWYVLNTVDVERAKRVLPAGVREIG